MAMAIVMMITVCEEVVVLFGGFMVGGVAKEECEERVESERRHVAVALVYEQKQQKGSGNVKL